MRAVTLDSSEWNDGFLFVANRPVLDFLNTKPVLAQGPVELLPDFHSLERWLIAAGILNSAKQKALVRNWRNSPEAALFLKDLIAFRERLRDAVLRIEGSSAPGEDFIQEVNRGLLRYPLVTTLRKREGRIVREPYFELKRPSDLWAFFFAGAAELMTEPQTARLRQCEACIVHFFDISKKGSRRWCSMNLCGNKVKVAAYQRRKRDGGSAG